jgi:prevent-host-death family protein
MRTVTMRDLAANLSSWLAAAERGEEIVITRDGKPVARLVPARMLREHAGALVGTEAPSPVLRAPTKGKYLEFLERDRRGDVV